MSFLSRVLEIIINVIVRMQEKGNQPNFGMGSSEVGEENLTDT